MRILSVGIVRARDDSCNNASDGVVGLTLDASVSLSRLVGRKGNRMQWILLSERDTDTQAPS